ncbi:MAG: TonB-dependent receptor [Bacteroidota bacterium]
MRNFKTLLVALFFMTSATLLAQTQVTGTVMDETGALPGANVIEKGTSNGTTTDFDGNFTLQVNEGSGVLEISFVGMTTRDITFTAISGETVSIGNISLVQDENVLDEVVVTGVVDFAKERETPVAVSTIRAVDIQENLGTQELPEILNTTPSIYATKQGGGYGDSRINVRGFNSRNTAIMINGMPVNDMENGWVYWSNWAGLSDVTSAMQVQRGLGSSKLAISSVGGTINVLTKTSQAREGGAVSFTLGNDSYMKEAASYSTGLLDSGLSASVLLSHYSGDGYIDGTKGNGWNYFIGLGYEINTEHSLMFTFTGAPQWHNQNSYANPISVSQLYGKNGEPNRKYNSNWGYLNGEEFSYRRNFYHKPIMSLNYDWVMSENSNLSTIVYGSWGRGGGTGPIGRINGGRDYYGQFKDANGLIRFDDIAKWNSGGSVPDFGDDRVPNESGEFINDRYNGFTRRASMNSHNWYGIISNFHNDVNENFSWDLGIDARTYQGFHYRVVNNDLGADGYTDDRDKNNPNRMITEYVAASPSFNPWANIKDQQKIEYYNVGGVKWFGGFGQVEYKTETISTFLQFGISKQSFKRTDYFNLLEGEQESGWEGLVGGNIKGGINWNINENHSLFANTGYYSKQPLFSAVYPSYNSNDVNEGLTNEKIYGLEFGYNFIMSNFNLKANVYRTSWKDVFKRQSVTLSDDSYGYADFQGIEQVHIGLELESYYRLNDHFSFNGMLSIGNWKYNGDVTGTLYDENNEQVGGSGETYYLDGVKVGDAAQTTAALGATYRFLDGFNFGLNWRYAGNLYAAINTDDFDHADHDGSLKLPSFNLVDARISYNWRMKNNNSLMFSFNMNNLFDELYISESDTNRHAEAGDDTWRGVNTDNRVYFGWGRSWNTSVKFRF